MSCVSIDLIGSGNTLFPDSLLPVMRKALYIQCVTTRAAMLPIPFPQRLIRLMRKKTKQTNKKISRASKLDNMSKSNTFSVFLSFCQTKPLKIWQLTFTAKLL